MKSRTQPERLKKEKKEGKKRSCHHFSVFSPTFKTRSRLVSKHSKIHYSVYIIVAIVRIENFIYFSMPAFIVKTYGFSPVFINPCYACPWNIFRVLKVCSWKVYCTKKIKNHGEGGDTRKKTTKNYCFYRINLLECVSGVRFEVVSS